MFKLLRHDIIISTFIRRIQGQSQKRTQKPLNRKKKSAKVNIYKLNQFSYYLRTYI